MKKKTKFKASSIGYAVVFMLLIGLLCTSLLFVVSSHKRLESVYLVKEHIIFNNLFAIHYGSKYIENGTKTIYHTSGDTSQIKVNNWGAYKVISVKTINNMQVIQRSVFSGVLLNDNSPAIFLSDQNSALKTNGKIYLEGDIFLPELGFQNGHIIGELNKISGDYIIKKSNQSLPALKKNYSYKLGDFQDYIEFSSIEKDTCIDFFNKTHLYSTVQFQSIRNKLKGNIIIHSNDSIFVDGKAELDGVILIAPVIYFSSGFRGNVQAFATKRIYCEEKTNFLYPSSFVLNYIDRSDFSSQVYLGRDSKLLGGILVYTNSDSRKLELIIEEKSIVAGLIYNEGYTEMNGECYGTLITKFFRLHAAGGIYSNQIRNARFSRKKLPEKFGVPNWIEHTLPFQEEIIKWY